jgi:hypothetical protein
MLAIDTGGSQCLKKRRRDKARNGAGALWSASVTVDAA